MLLGEGWQAGRKILLEALDAALERADPYRAARNVVRRENAGIRIGGHWIPDGRAVHFLGAGKASAPIAEAVEDELGDALAGGICVIKRGQTCRTDRIRVMVSDHPVPSQHSFDAGAALLDYALQAVKPGDVVMVGITGGSSALASLPPTSVPPEAKADLHRCLLASGLSIDKINTVRKHVSRIKGGRLAAAMPEAHIFNLTVSDVSGDALDLITDPTVVDTSTLDDAIRILQTAQIWEHLHPAVQEHLQTVRDDVLSLPQVHESLLLVTGTDVADAVAENARNAGREAFVFSTSLSGEAREVGRVLGCYARERMARREPTLAVLAGGETTVTLPEDRLGAGGPNLELAAAFAIEIQGMEGVALLSLDSDGQDGSTSLAGALVDGTTVQDASMFSRALARHELFRLATDAGFGIEMGQTRTNVNDITLMLVDPML